MRLMKLLFDLLPLIAFFATYQLARFFPEAAAAFPSASTLPTEQLPMLLATAATMLVTAAQILWLRLRGQKIEKMLWITAVLVLGLGAATLFLHDPRFIQFKPTAVYWSFGSALLLARLWRKNLLQLALAEKVCLAARRWNQLSDAWAGFFFFLGALNLWVAHAFSEATWVYFKMFGTIGLTLVFVILQAWWMTWVSRNEEETHS